MKPELLNISRNSLCERGCNHTLMISSLKMIEEVCSYFNCVANPPKIFLFLKFWYKWKHIFLNFVLFASNFLQEQQFQWSMRKIFFHPQLGKSSWRSNQTFRNSSSAATAPPWVQPVSPGTTNSHLPTAIEKLSKYFSVVFTPMLDLCSRERAMSRRIVCNPNTTLQRSWLWTMYGRVFTLRPSVWLVPDEAEPSTCQAALGLNWGDVWREMNDLLIMHLSGSGFNKQIEWSVFHSELSRAPLSLSFSDKCFV